MLPAETHGGAAVVGAESNVELSVCNMTRNHAGSYGGAVAVTSQGFAYTSTVAGYRHTVVFVNNTAKRGGGALSLGLDAAATLSGALFEGNAALTGGAIYTDATLLVGTYHSYGVLRVSNTTFLGNKVSCAAPAARARP